MPKLDFTRRQVLRGVGGFSLALPALYPRQGRAAEAGVPRRLVIFYIPEGSHSWNTFFPIVGPTGDFSLPASQSSAPLAPYKNRLTFVKGVHLESTRRDASCLHGIGHQHLLTGGPSSPALTFMHPLTHAPVTAPAGISIDRLVASALGQSVPFGSFEFGIRTTINNPGAFLPISYDNAKTPRFPSDSPYKNYQTLFGTKGQPASPDLARAAAEAQKRRLSVLDLVASEAASLRSDLGCDARHKLDAHLSGIRTIEQQLKTVYEQKPNMTVTPVSADVDKIAEDLTKVPQIADLQMNLAVSAMQGDLLRVATIRFARTYGLDRLPFVSFVDQRLYNIGQHGFSHAEAGEKDSGVPGAVIEAEKKKIFQWYAGQLKLFLDKMDAVKEPNGKTLLENSLVVQVSEMSHGNHGRSNLPIILAGGAQGSVKLGRYFDLNGLYDNFYNTTAPSPEDKPGGGRYLNSTGRSLNDLFITAARAMGIALDRFGVTAASGGPISELLA